MSECVTHDAHSILKAMVSDGDSRLCLDPLGLNKYLCPPAPSPSIACLSSCTASPVSEAGFAAASAMLQRIAAAGSPESADECLAECLAECQSGVAAAIRTYLRLDRDVEVMLTASGTDGLLLASVLLAIEARCSAMTAILPAAPETGSGALLAATCRMFDGTDAGRRVIDIAAEPVCVPVRALDGTALEAGAVSEAFQTAIAATRHRPTLFLTHGTKTGLVTPAEGPDGVEVVVDACQLRLSSASIRNYLRRGWQVVITGSKALGGPAFSGAVLLPASRFSAATRQQAMLACRTQVNLGLLLRWTAALAQVVPDHDAASISLARMAQQAEATVTALPGARVINGAGTDAGIVTFAVEPPGQCNRWLSSAELRTLYRNLAGQGVLLGQPVELGSFGGLRVAIGMRDVARGTVTDSLQRLSAAWFPSRRSLGVALAA